MITTSDSLNTIDISKYYLILNDNQKCFEYYKKNFKAKFVSKNFSYASNTNNKFFNIKDLKKFLKIYESSQKNN